MTQEVTVAISAFRSDEPVIAMLEAIAERPSPHVRAVIVVDSLGSGAIADAIARNGWEFTYVNAETNLGSAGNLARRIELAAQSGADWAYCLNHDAQWSPDALAAQLALGRSRPRVGAVYPVLHHGSRKRPWEDARRSFSPFANERSATRPIGDEGIEVAWSSSNGALYATAPSHEGVRVMPELWMGFEDLAYGVALDNAGWTQLVCRDAVLGDIFDYVGSQIGGLTVHRPYKPTWYAYYDIRNLLLIRREYGSAGIPLLSIAKKLAKSTTRIILLDDHKADRLRLLYRGSLAGLTGKTGKGPVP